MLYYAKIHTSSFVPQLWACAFSAVLSRRRILSRHSISNNSSPRDCRCDFHSHFPWNSFILYNVAGYLTTSEHQLCNITPLRTPFRLLIGLLQSQSHVTTITHNYFLRCTTFTQLTILHASIPFLTSTHIHTSNKHSVHTLRNCFLPRTYCLALLKLKLNLLTASLI
jgi:hypothetical protein